MKKRLFVAALAVAALAPLGAARASGGVVVSVSTPEFGFRIGAPIFGPPVYAPVYAPPPVVVAPPVIVPAPVYAPPVVMVPPPRVILPAPIVVAPRPVIYAPAYAPVYAPRARVIHPRGEPRPYYGAPMQQVGYWGPPGHAKHAKGKRYE
ncbi:MAG TPA: hypothetical protein PLW72_00935 [Burkholderiaceae bacterium]|nr:hypothetical protein [Burkholderiaceae bacterium]HQR75420.1 hypothetical protein [Burkholderiaceae bacterium]